MSKKIFEVMEISVNEEVKVPGSISWRYALKGTTLKLTNGKHIRTIADIKVGDIIFADFNGDDTVVSKAKMPKHPLRALAWKYGFTGANLVVSPEFMTMVPVVWDSVIDTAQESDHFDLDCWAENGHEHRRFPNGGYDAAYADVSRKMLERDGEFIAVAYGRIYNSNSGVQKWAISSRRALDLFTEEELVKLFESVHAHKKF